MVAGLLRLFLTAIIIEFVVGPFTTSRRSVIVPRLKPCASGSTDSRNRTEKPCKEYDLGIEYADSWSPVKKIGVFCAQRRPMHRVDRKCNETMYCRNPATKELARSLAIYELKKMMAFCITTPDGVGYIKEEEVSVGCICIVPVPR